MPDVKDVYEMVTQQTPPKPDALERQRKRQMRHTINQKLGAFAAVAVIAGLALLAVRVSSGDGGQRPASSPDTAPTATVPDVRKVDHTIDLNTGAMTPLPEAIVRSIDKTGGRGQYAVSHDGSRLAYVGTGDEGSPQIFIAGVKGTGVRQMTHDPRGAESPAWSPDGTRIAYEGYDGDVHNLFVLDVATGKSTQITHESPLCGRSCYRWPQFTPDGSSLIYTGGSEQQPVVRTVPVAGGKSTLLIGPGEGITDAGDGSMSPDGSLVTFLGSGFSTSGGHCGPCRFMANADGTERRVIPGWMSIPAGTWSPDGSRIVVSDGETAPTIIVVVDVATRAATTVAKGRAAIWIDDHTLLVEV